MNNTKVQDKLKFFPDAYQIDVSRIFKLLRSRKYKITDERVISCPESPTGKAFVGVSKRPLQMVKNGYGYMGVLLQTDNRTLVRCHECGKWMRRISGQHLALHGLVKATYQEKYGLYKGTSLVADATSYKLEAAGMKRILMYPTDNNKLLIKGRKVLAASAKKRRSNLKNVVEHQNRYAICEQQLGYRLIEYMKKFQNLPSRSGKNEGRLIGKALHRRYGSINEGFKHYGVPLIHRQGTNVELVAQDGKQLFFNYNKDYNRESVYHWMVQHSPVLWPQNINIFRDSITKA